MSKIGLADNVYCGMFGLRNIAETNLYTTTFPIRAPRLSTVIYIVIHYALRTVHFIDLKKGEFMTLMIRPSENVVSHKKAIRQSIGGAWRLPYEGRGSAT